MKALTRCVLLHLLNYSWVKVTCGTFRLPALRDVRFPGPHALFTRKSGAFASRREDSAAAFLSERQPYSVRSGIR